MELEGADDMMELDPLEPEDEGLWTLLFPKLDKSKFVFVKYRSNKRYHSKVLLFETLRFSSSDSKFRATSIVEYYTQSNAA